jgi:hypothetical protein
LGAYVAGDVSEPWQRGAQLSQLVDLVEGGRIPVSALDIR